eukprot:760046-Hanusia_phi.AAC.1
MRQVETGRQQPSRESYMNRYSDGGDKEIGSRAARGAWDEVREARSEDKKARQHRKNEVSSVEKVEVSK